MFGRIFEYFHQLGDLFFDTREPDGASLFAADTTAIPDKFMRFVPIDAGVSTGEPHWIVAEDNIEQCVDVKRRNLFTTQVICLGIFLFIVGVSFLAYFNVRAVADNASLIALIVLNVVGTVITLLMSVGVVAAHALMCYSNSRYWKGPLHFRYRLDLQELFFPRENHVYRQSECKRIILGYIIGYDTRHMWKRFGVPMTGGRGGGMGGNPLCQCFVLVQTSTDEWKRHEIGYDLTRSRKQFNKLVSILQPLTNCEVLYRKYSLNECFDEQPGYHR